MELRIYRAFLLPVWTAAICISAFAQSARTITIRLLDGKTGEPLTPSNIMVRLDHKEAVNSDWVRQKDDGTAEVTLPGDASVVAVHATYDNSMEFYINCDVGRQKDTASERWYPVSEILTTGIVAPNECSSHWNGNKLRMEAKPGEFVVFLRRRNWREQD